MLNFFSGIKGRLVLYFIVVGSIFGFVVSSTTYSFARDALVDSAFNVVEVLGATRKSQLLTWVSSLRIDIEAFSTNQSVTTALRAFRNTFDTSPEVGVTLDERRSMLRESFVGHPELVEVSDVSSPYVSVHSRFHGFFQSMESIYGFSDIYLISPDGNVIYTSQKKDDVFTNLVSGPYSGTGLSRAFTSLESVIDQRLRVTVFTDFSFYEPFGRSMAFISSPVFSDTEFLGVVVFALPVEFIDSVINAEIGFGDTGETYLVGSDYLPRSSFGNADGLNLSENSELYLDTESVVNAFEGEAVVGITENYVGVEVLSSSSLVVLQNGIESLGIDEVQWALVSEIGASESIELANALVGIVVVSALISLLVLGGLSYFLANQISEPIVVLTNIAKRLAGGDFDVTFSRYSISEISLLASAFDSMRKQISELIANLDRIVQRRTRDLRMASEVARKSTHQLDLNRLLDEIAMSTRDAFSLYRVSVYLYDDRNVLDFATGYGKEGAYRDQQVAIKILEDDMSPLVRCVKRRDIIIEDDLLKNPYAYVSGQARSQIVIPLIVNEDLLGVLNLESDVSDFFSDDILEVFASLGDQLAIAIQNAQLYSLQLQVAEELKKLDELKSQFLARMSHELRTPLNSVLNFTKFTLKEWYGPITERQEEYLGRVVESGEHLLVLINDILDMSKMDNGMMKLLVEDGIDVNGIVSTVVMSSESLVKNTDVELEMDLDEGLPSIVGDQRRIRQILVNLVANGVKYTKSGVVHVKTLLANDFVCVEVSDTGIGIAADNMEAIFEPFHQLAKPVNGEGTGLGLTITKRLVEAHGGTVEVDSKIGVGTTFIVRLPVSSPILVSMLPR